MIMNGQIPIGVKIISILYYIGAVIGIIFGLLFIFGGSFLKAGSFLKSSLGFIGALGSIFFIVMGIIFVGLGVLGFFIGRGLWKVKSWARILAIIFACLGVLLAVISMIQGKIVSNIFNLVINLVIGGYLLFSNSVKEAFSS